MSLQRVSRKHRDRIVCSWLGMHESCYISATLVRFGPVDRKLVIRQRIPSRSQHFAENRISVYEMDIFAPPNKPYYAKRNLFVNGSLDIAQAPEQATDIVSFLP